MMNKVYIFYFLLYRLSFLILKIVIPTLIFKPDWSKHGRSAGMIRNKDIVSNADLVVAFWDGRSRGTRNSIEHAKTLKKTLSVIFF